MEKIKNVFYMIIDRISSVKLTYSQKNDLYKIGASLVLLVVALFFSKVWAAQLIICLVSYAICAYNVILTAIKRAVRGNVFEEHMLMSVASIGAFAIGEFTEACAVMILYQIGELFQSVAVNRSRRSIKAMMEIRPETAHKVVIGEVVDVDTSTITVGDIILVRPGERVPVDGVVTGGVLEADTSAITGESLPVTIHEGEAVISGCINLTNVVRIRATSSDADSMVSRILKIVEEQSENKSENERLVTRFAKYYTPAVFGITLLVAILGSIITGDIRLWIYRALSLLVISCPCALVISVPLTYFSGIGGASSLGILVKGANVIDELCDCNTLILDKTGTLTTGKLYVTDVCPSNSANENILLTVAAISEGESNHPLAKAIVEYVKLKGIDARESESFTEVPGRGTAALLDGHVFAAGEASFLYDLGVEADIEENEKEKRVHFALDKKYVGYIALCDKIKPDADLAVSAVRDAGITLIGMFSGDRRVIAEEVAGELGLDMCESELTPEDKLDLVKRLKEAGNKVIFAGDGINDAPTLGIANVGIAMGDIGSDAALEAADVVIMNGELRKIAQAAEASKYTVRLVKQNMVMTIGIKLAVLILTICGLTNMPAAIFADVGVCVIAILNAVRALKVKM
ncbi:MAG: cadmium-translocating P-type ATPase [Ruminococcaceae bacterium]|nr:cadmium-translocating P-type ATPase [Oscillospiraceae bacterium]